MSSRTLLRDLIFFRKYSRTQLTIQSEDRGIIRDDTGPFIRLITHVILLITKFSATSYMKDLIKRATEEIKADEDLILLSVFAAILSAIGIYFNDTPILIGSMIVSPFFNPIVSFCTLLWSKNKGKRIAVRNFVLITVISLLISVVLFSILSFFNIESDSVYEPNLGPEYLFAAVILGMTGTFLWIWPNMSNVGVGVSIAISLIPPLVNISRGLVLADMNMTWKSILAFLLNTVGILIGSLIVLIIKFPKRK